MRHGKIAYFEALGSENTRNGAVMQKGSLFRIYSMTKPIVSVAVMMLWEEGRFDIDDPIAKYLPELKDLKVAIVGKGGDAKSTVVLEPVRRDVLRAFELTQSPNRRDMGRDHLRRKHRFGLVTCPNTHYGGECMVNRLCFGWAPVARRVDDATEHQIGEARFRRTERRHLPLHAT
jgi:hypothetical protein